MAGEYDATYNGYYSIGMPGPGGNQGQLFYHGQGKVQYTDDKNWVFRGNPPNPVIIKSQWADVKNLTKQIGWWGGKSRRNRKSKKSKKRKSRKTIRRR